MMSLCCQGISSCGIDDVGLLNSSLPVQNGRHFTDGTFKHILMNEKFFNSIRISLKFVPKGPVDKKAALVQVMAGWRTGDKPLPEPMLTQFTNPYMQHQGGWVKKWCGVGATEPVLWMLMTWC